MMKRWFSAILSLMMMMSFALAEEATDPDALIANAQKCFESMLANDFDPVVEQFDETMSAKVSAETLSAGLNSIAGMLGAYKGLMKSETAEQGEYLVVQLTEEYEKGGILLQIAYSKDGKISGMNMNFADISQAKENGDRNYQEIELSVAGDENLPLGATLCLPENVQNPPVVLLVHGSGSSNRNEAIGSCKPFADIADGLAQKGIATLRYDKRYFVYPDAASALGAKLTVRDEVLDDVNAAIELLRADGRVDVSRIYVLGHSLGGMLIPVIASENPDLAGVISMAGSLRPFWEIVYDQNQDAIKRAEASDLSESDQATLKQQIDAIEADIKTLRGDFSQVPDDTKLLGIDAGYLKSLKEYGGMNFIDELTLPMLILQGSADFQVYPDKDFELWKETLKDRENVEFELFEGLNHLMMPTQGQHDLSEYTAENHVRSDVIESIANFVLN